MSTLLASLSVLGASLLLLLGSARAYRWPSRLGLIGTILGCGLGLAAAIPATFGAPEESLRLAWSMPYASFHLGLDPLTGFFLIPIFVVSLACAIYAKGSLSVQPAQSQALAWGSLLVLILSMVLVVCARNGILFLLAWEPRRASCPSTSGSPRPTKRRRVSSPRSPQA